MNTESLGIAINVYRESIQQISECIIRIATHLPYADVAIFIDGQDRRDVNILAENFGFTVIQGKSLGSNDTWHLWWLRMLTWTASNEHDIFLKLDPDSMVDRSPHSFPEYSYFGSVTYSTRYKCPFVQGGITGLSRNTIAHVIESQLLVPDARKRWFSKGFGSSEDLADDQMLGFALKHIDVLPMAWMECRSLWRTPVANDGMKFAFVHPRYY
jgi:hypothetical protein